MPAAAAFRILEDFDDTLTRMLEKYFQKKKIPNFKVTDIKLQIIGTLHGKKRTDH
jgi:hypothetical protein